MIKQLRIHREYKRNECVLVPQWLDGHEWKKFEAAKSPLSISVHLAKFHGNELGHLSERRISRAMERMAKCLEEWRDKHYPKATITKDGNVEKEEIKEKEKKEKDPCKRCGEPMSMIPMGSFHKLKICHRCREVPVVPEKKRDIKTT